MAIMALAVLSDSAPAEIVWDVDTPIWGGKISSPPDNGVYLCGASVTCEASRGSDTDHWCDTTTGQEGFPPDAMLPGYPFWTATAGSWKDGDNSGASVQWIAPDIRTTNITLKIYDDDLPNSIPPWDSGTRNDWMALQDQATSVQAIIPDCNEVTYGAATGSKYAIAGISTPEYIRDQRNDSACWGLEARASATVSFIYPELSEEEACIKVRGETDGDMFNIGDWGDSGTATWPITSPTPAQTCNAEMLMDDEVEWRDYDAQWRYKCTDGSNSWINSTNQKDCRLYVVLAQPKSPESPPQEEILEYATNWADGSEDAAEACDAMLNAFSDHYTWNMNCHQLSSDYVRLIASIGVYGSLHRWASKAAGLGDMCYQRTKSIDPVGATWESGTIEWSWHQWAEADSKQRDPSAAASLSGTWGDYEDDLFTHYRECTQVSPSVVYTWVANQSGQSSGCEVYPTHCYYYNSGILQSWRGPDR